MHPINAVGLIQFRCRSLKKFKTQLNVTGNAKILQVFNKYFSKPRMDDIKI